MKTVYCRRRACGHSKKKEMCIRDRGITDMADSAGWTIKTEGGVISIGDGAQQESFLPEDCIPFGTTALVLCRNGRPVWTLALGEDCQTDGGVLLEGSLIACRASMEQTAPIVFSLTH